MVIGEDEIPKGELRYRQYKNIKAERIKLVLGPTNEVDTVRRIFQLFVFERRSVADITRTLNREGVPVARRTAWKTSRIRGILSNENYIGNIVYGRRSQKLRGPVRATAPETWVRCEHALPPVVDRKCFDAAQKLIAVQTHRKTDAEILNALTRLYKQTGRLSKSIVDQSHDVPSVTMYRSRFGSLRSAYALIGHPPPRSFGRLRGDAQYWRACARLAEIIGDLQSSGSSVVPGPHRALFCIDGRFTLRIALVARTKNHGSGPQWRIRLKTLLNYDLVLACRMNEGNADVLDFFLLPPDIRQAEISLGTTPWACHSDLRLATLDPLLALCALARGGAEPPRTVRELRLFLSAPREPLTPS
jgi:hypothetical protein